MNDDGLQQLLREATQDISKPTSFFAGDNWPVALLSIAGGWLVSLPVVGLILSLVYLFFQSQNMLPVILLGIAGVLTGEGIARSYSNSLFAQHFGNSTFIIGISLLGFACFIDNPGLAPSLLILPICFAAFTVSADWLRLPLGVTAACMLAMAWQRWLNWEFTRGMGLLNGLYGCLAVWLFGHVAQKHLLTGLDDADIKKMQAFSDGWLLTTWAALCVFSGSSLVLTASLPFDLPVNYGDYSAEAVADTSVALTVVGVIWLLRCWPSMRNWRGVGAGIAIAELAYFTPMLGPLIIGLVGCSVRRKWRMAAAACVFAVWIVGSQYYQTDWPLLMKGEIMGSIGATLLLCAYFPYSASKSSHLLLRTDEEPIAPAIDTQRLRRLAGLGTLLVLSVTSIIISMREYTVAHGIQVFFRLAPADPRSLIQGDYMRLNVDLGKDQDTLLYGSGRVVIQRDKNGIAKVTRILADNDLLKDDEYVIDLQYESGTWRLPSDAWYFTEGDGDRWASARFGEYRLDRNGRAMLVGLRSDKLEPL